jgi:hypothetical protein
MRETIRDSEGREIAWLDDGQGCENPACIAAIAEGFPFHIIPSHRDPRAADVHLALSTYHYATPQDAVMALEHAWQTARTVHSVAERDAAYRMHRDIKIPRNTGNRRDASGPAAKPSVTQRHSARFPWKPTSPGPGMHR